MVSFSEIVLGEHKIGTDPDCQTGESGNLNCQPNKIVRQPAEIFVHENYDRNSTSKKEFLQKPIVRDLLKCLELLFDSTSQLLPSRLPGEMQL